MTLSRFQTVGCILIVACGICALATTAANAQQDLTQLIAKVKPSVVQVKLANGGTGSGFIVHQQGIVATNYHVIEGATEAKIAFPGTNDKKEYRVEGFLGILPGKDLALIYFKPEGKTLVPLPFATKTPSQGEAVATFGAPKGFGDTVSQGIVSSVRTGEQLRDLMKRGNVDAYGKDGLGYDIDVEWLQTTAPISPGNSGGPLVNMRGELVGVNTWCRTDGQNLNFSLSSKHVREFLASLGSKPQLQAFARLPPPRQRHAGPSTGDYAKTRAAWVLLNNALNDVHERVESAEKKLRDIPPPDPRYPIKNRNLRIKKKVAAFEQMTKAYKDYLGKIKALDTRDFDPDLIVMLLKETSIVQATADTCHEISNLSSAEAADGDSVWEVKLTLMKQLWSDHQAKRDAVRMLLCHKYNKQFPTPEETKSNGGLDSEAAPGNKETEKEKKPEASNEEESPKKADPKKKPDPSAQESEDSSAVRTWTDRDGRTFRAKFEGIENGDVKRVKLRRPDGKLFRVPIDRFSEADRKFLGED